MSVLMSRVSLFLVLAGCVATIGCGGDDRKASYPDSGRTQDAGRNSTDARISDSGSVVDASSMDANSTDASSTDGSLSDSGASDSGANDSGSSDGGPSDSGPSDSGPSDSGTPDSGPSDSGPSDSGPSDSGSGDSGPSDGGTSDSGTSDGGLCTSVPIVIQPVSATYSGTLDGCSDDFSSCGGTGSDVVYEVTFTGTNRVDVCVHSDDFSPVLHIAYPETADMCPTGSCITECLQCCIPDSADPPCDGSACSRWGSPPMGTTVWYIVDATCSDSCGCPDGSLTGAFTLEVTAY